MTFRTYWRAMDTTLSCRLLSNGNWKAIVNTDRVLWNEFKSPALWFVVEPTSRLDVRSNVRCVAKASFESLCINNWKTLVCWEREGKQHSHITQIPWSQHQPMRSTKNSTVFDSKGIMRKPEGSNGASSGNISSIGAKTSSEQAPTAFSSTPLHICQ